MEFRKVRNYANFAIISLVLGLIIFTIFSIYLKKVTLGLIIFFISLGLFIYFIVSYKCPDCESKLFFSCFNKKIKVCPKCQARLRK